MRINWSLWISVLAIVVSIASFGWGYMQYKLAPKRDVLRRYMGNIFVLTKTNLRDHSYEQRELFQALNEARIVFSDSKEVVLALRELTGDETAKDHVRLMRAMAEAAWYDLSEYDDSFLERPFYPNHPPKIRN